MVLGLWAVVLGLWLLPSGCTPPIDPAWLIERPSELGLGVTVVRQGSYGAREPADAPRALHEALPLDTLRLQPFIADTRGALAGDDLDAIWIACATARCVRDLRRDSALPSCSEVDPRMDNCEIGRGPELSFQLPDFPPDLQEVSLVALTGAPPVLMVASRRNEPGAEACIERLSARTSLAGCLLMFRPIAVGSLGELAAAARSQGIVVEVSPSTEFLLATPRNHAPQVNTFEVLGSSRTDDTVFPAGSTVAVRRGDELEIRYLPDEADVDLQTLNEGAQAITFAEQLTRTWRMDRPATVFDPGPTGLAWTVAGLGTAHLHLVVHDESGSEAWGMLTFEIES